MPSSFLLLALGAATLAASSITPSQKVYDFGAEDDSRWYTIHDSVMGGISDGNVRRTESGTLLFEGNLSLENNGGFASFRSADRDLRFADSDGIEIKVLGDGRTYICSFEREGVNLFGGGYWQEFETRDGAWTVVRLPWSDFVPYSFGNRRNDLPALSSESARGLGVYLYDKQEGPYRVEFDSFSTYTEADDDAGNLVNTNTTTDTESTRPRERGLESYLDGVVNQGVVEFNGGDTAACETRYRQALEAVLALTAIDGPKATAIEMALVRAASQDSRAAAWTLRRTIDDLRRG